jgi:hypothetical protein
MGCVGTPIMVLDRQAGRWQLSAAGMVHARIWSGWSRLILIADMHVVAVAMAAVVVHALQGLSDLWQLMQQQGVAVDAIPSLLMDAEAHNLTSTLVAHLRQLEARSSSGGGGGGAADDSAAFPAAGQLQAGGSVAGSRVASSGGGAGSGGGVGGPTLDDLKQRLNQLHMHQTIASKASPVAAAPEPVEEVPVAAAAGGGAEESPGGGGLIGTSGRASGGGVQHNSMMQSLRDRMKGLKS